MHERADTIEAASALAEELAGAGVAGVTIAWADNNGIPRSRTVPVGRLADVAVQGVGITTLFAVFDWRSTSSPRSCWPTSPPTGSRSASFTPSTASRRSSSACRPRTR